MKTAISLSQAIFGFKLAAQARHLSPHTLADYLNTLHKFQDFMGSDIAISKIATANLEGFLAKHAPRLSKKTLLNYHTGLSAFYTWLVAEGIYPYHLMHAVERPRPEIRTIQTIPVAHVRAMFSAIERSKGYSRRGSKVGSNLLPFAQRNRLILLLLLDTGLRASELCGLRMNAIDLEQNRLKVFGKGDKERYVYISPRTGQSIWRYLAEKRLDPRSDAFLLSTRDNRPMDRNNLRHLLGRICIRAGVPVYTPHDFRHTFATEYLRNHANIYALQETLGHTTLDMVKKYLAISQQDLSSTHKLASPVEKWGL